MIKATTSIKFQQTKALASKGKNYRKNKVHT